MTSSSGASEVYASQTTTYAMSCQDTSGQTVTCSPATITITPTQTTSDISVTTNLGGSVWNFWPGNTNYIGNQNLTVTPGNAGTLYSVTPADETGYSWNVVNSKGGGTSMMVFPGESDSFSITYSQSAPTFDYSLSNSGDLTIYKGGVDVPGQETITKTLTAGTSQSVSLNVAPTIPNIDVALSGGGVCNPTCSNTITFTVHPGAAAGDYPMTVTGSPSNHTTSFTLHIVNSPAVNVTCSASPSPALVGQPVTWTANATGGSGSYTQYVWSGTSIPTSPAPTGNPYTVTYSTVGAKNASVEVTDSRGDTGSCTPQGTVQINFNPQFKEI